MSCVLIFAGVFASPLVDLFRYSSHPDHSRYASYVLFIPFISGYLLYRKRGQILENRGISPSFGIPVIVAGMMIFFTTARPGSSTAQADWVSGQTFSIVVCWIGGFLLLFGTRSFRIARFPLLFLLFMVPIPTFAANGLSSFLQSSSSEVSDLLFRATGVPFVREGFNFQFSRFAIQVAPECSGMRATITLFVLGVLAGHLYLRTGWGKIVAAATIFPITIFGNSVRIVALTLLALFLERGFIVGDSMLHERGGWLLFGVDLVLLGGAITTLRKLERRCIGMTMQESR